MQIKRSVIGSELLLLLVLELNACHGLIVFVIGTAIIPTVRLIYSIGVRRRSRTVALIVLIHIHRIAIAARSSETPTTVD